SSAQLVNLSQEDFLLIFGNPESFLQESISAGTIDLEAIQKALAKKFTLLSKRFGRIPTLSELAEELEISNEQLGHLFGGSLRLFDGKEDLKSYAMRLNKAAFKNVIDTDLFSDAKATELSEAITKRKRMIVTTAVAGAPVNKEFFAALLNYAKKRDAEII